MIIDIDLLHDGKEAAPVNTDDHELTLEQIVEMVHLIPGDFVVYRLIGRTMKVLYFSDTILSSFCVSRAEFSAATEDDALDVVMPADRGHVIATVYGKPVSPELIHCQFRLMHREKGFFWVHSRSRVIGTMNGDAIILTNYLNASMEAESYSRILDDTATAFFTVDIQSREILYANQAARSLARVKNPNVYAGYACHEYFFRKAEPCGDCPMANLAMGRQCSFERCDEMDGHWSAVVFKHVAWLGHDCLEVSVNDITKMKERETALKQETMKFHQSVDRMLAMNPNAVCTFQINLTQNQCGEGHGS